MRGFKHGVSTMGIVLCAASWSAVAAADASGVPADTTRFYAFVGKWQGTGQVQEAGQPPVKLKLALACSKAAGGYAVSCTMQAKGKDMQSYEADLMGVDPATGKAHWYAISNMGETHDHLVEWQGDKSYQAHYAWTQDSKQMEENISVTFSGRKLEFRSVTSADGQEAGVFAGTLTR